jgi:hypothetical protein
MAQNAQEGPQDAQNDGEAISPPKSTSDALCDASHGASHANEPPLPAFDFADGPVRWLSRGKDRQGRRRIALAIGSGAARIWVEDSEITLDEMEASYDTTELQQRIEREGQRQRQQRAAANAARNGMDSGASIIPGTANSGGRSGEN